MAAQTVALTLQLAWSAGVPQLAVSAAPDWRLPGASVLWEASDALGVALSMLRIVGGALEREAARAVGAGWSDML